jgi:hypothetical protein
MTLTVTHKYKWKTDMKIAVPTFLLIIPTILWFATNPLTTYVVGGISVFTGLLITYLNVSRLNRSKLTATATDEGVLTITGSGLKETNSGILRDIVSVGSDKNVYHPTLVFYFENMKQLRVPKRIAELPEMNLWMKKNFPKTVNNFKDEKAILIFEELFIPEDKRKFTEQYNIEQKLKEENDTNENVENENISTGKVKKVKKSKTDAAKRKEEARKEKAEREARIAASIAALEKEEKKLGL